MKYKNIKSWAHNLGHSFLSDTNLVACGDGHYGIVAEELFAAAEAGRVPTVLIDFLANTVLPTSVATPEVLEGVAHYHASLARTAALQNVEASRLAAVTLTLDFNYLLRRRQREHPHQEIPQFRCTVTVTDDRGMSHVAHPDHWWRA